jgi:hypothetical protein
MSGTFSTSERIAFAVSTFRPDGGWPTRELAQTLILWRMSISAGTVVGISR